MPFIKVASGLAVHGSSFKTIPISETEEPIWKFFSTEKKRRNKLGNTRAGEV